MKEFLANNSREITGMEKLKLRSRLVKDHSLFDYAQKQVEQLKRDRVYLLEAEKEL